MLNIINWQIFVLLSHFCAVYKYSLKPSRKAERKNRIKIYQDLNQFYSLIKNKSHNRLIAFSQFSKSFVLETSSFLQVTSSSSLYTQRYYFIFLYFLWKFFFMFTPYTWLIFFFFRYRLSPFSPLIHASFLLLSISSLFFIPFVDNILLSINPVFFSYLCLLRYFGYTRLFSFSFSVSVSSFLNFFIYISLLDLSSLCFAGSLLVALTARNQYIPLHISYPYFEPPSRPLPLILTHQSHNAATLITSTSSLFHSISFRS